MPIGPAATLIGIIEGVDSESILRERATQTGEPNPGGTNNQEMADFNDSEASMSPKSTGDVRF